MILGEAGMLNSQKQSTFVGDRVAWLRNYDATLRSVWGIADY